MAENTDEEHLDIPTYNQPENSSEEITPTADTEIINPNQETENMEVHHHPDLHHKPKKWKEYFLEFLMIFLAVTMGFFAESYREYLSDRTKEKEYIRAMVEDLKNDSAFLVSSINDRIPYHVTMMDSAIHLLQGSSVNGKDRLIYQAFFIGTAWTYNFHPTQRTLSQLHSEGFHLLRNKTAKDIISQLEDGYKISTQGGQFAENMQNDIDISAYVFADRDVTDKISVITFRNFDENNTAELQLSDIPESAKINTDNKEAIQSYTDKLKKYSFYIKAILKSSDITTLKIITKTIAVLKKEYNLE